MRISLRRRGISSGRRPMHGQTKTQLTLTLRVDSELQTLTAEGEYHCVY